MAEQDRLRTVCGTARIFYPAMPSVCLYPNPLIQSLQLANSQWPWAGEGLTVFWRTTKQTMVLQGWNSWSSQWSWHDVKRAHLLRLGWLPDNTDDSIRLEGCIAVWLVDGAELRGHPKAVEALLTMYLPQIEHHCLDEEAALLWAAMLDYERYGTNAELKNALRAWQCASGNQQRWTHAYNVVCDLGLVIGVKASYMHNILHGAACCEIHSIEGLIT